MSTDILVWLYWPACFTVGILLRQLVRQRRIRKWKKAFADYLHKRLEGHFSMQFCRDCADAGFENVSGDLSENPIDCAIDELQAMADNCDPEEADPQ